jgi:predicted alpha/beta hydrolase family esterase
MMKAPLLFLPAGFICVGARGHISTEPDTEDWLEGRGLLEVFASYPNRPEFQ